MTADAQTIPLVLARRRCHDPEVEALVSDDDSITYAELDRTSASLARRLVAAGAGSGSRIGLLMPNGIDWATAALAVMRVGGVLVPLSTLLRPVELHAQLRTAAVTHLVAVREFRGRAYLDDLEEVAPGIGNRTTSGRHPALPALLDMWEWGNLPTEEAPAGIVEALEAAVRPANDMAIMFTSGSRGAPKGVIHTHGNALRATAAGLESRQIGPRERLYIPMPFFWMGGFGGGLLSTVVAGATLLTESIPEPARTIRFLERERATLFRGWPDQAARIAAEPTFATSDLSSLRPASLGAVLPPAQRARPGARANLFGMTESFGPYSGTRLDLDLPPSAHGSCGRPFAGIDLRIVDPSTDRPVAPGVEGEIRLRGPNMMRGICGLGRSQVFTPDGFYRTGDLGHIDDDGYLFFDGRLDDMFKVKGATVYPLEVEAALRTIPGVSQAFVTNVSGAGGSEQVGAVVLVPDLLSDTDLLEAARARLSSFKVPTLWLIVHKADEVPMSGTGKPDKASIQDLLRSGGAPAPGNRA